MKLWEIKAQALRIMFADSDVSYTQNDFSNGIVYQNPNTKEKLRRMNDSIQRAIDLYFQQVGQITTVTQAPANEIIVINGDYPKRVDVLVYETIDGVKTLKKEIREVDFFFDEFNKFVLFHDIDYINEYSDFDVEYRTFYTITKHIIPSTANELTYDLDTYKIPREVQNMIPYFIKAELYEEDEPSIAYQSRQLYMQFLMNQRKPFSNIQTKVKRANVFSK